MEILGGLRGKWIILLLRLRLPRERGTLTEFLIGIIRRSITRSSCSITYRLTHRFKPLFHVSPFIYKKCYSFFCKLYNFVEKKRDVLYNQFDKFYYEITIDYKWKAFIFILCIKMHDKMEDPMFYINFMDNLINLQIMTRTETESERIDQTRNAETDTNLCGAKHGMIVLGGWVK